MSYGPLGGHIVLTVLLLIIIIIIVVVGVVAHTVATANLRVVM